MIREHYLEDVLASLRKYKDMAERAIAQIDRDDMFRTFDLESNSIAIVMKHMAGNMRSRWTDFLTTDGEKPDRHRDREFELSEEDTAESLWRAWERGWELTLEAIAALGWRDLERTVTIRGEPHTVVQAINRQLTHYAYHVGQIVWLAKHLAGDEWKSLSVPRGMSAMIEVSKDGVTYVPEPQGSAAAEVETAEEPRNRTLFDHESSEEN